MEAIFDRNTLDIQGAKEIHKKILSEGFQSLSSDEKTKWMSGMKGFLNYTDLNRIEGNCRILANLFKLPVVTVTNWSMIRRPKVSDFKRIRQNVCLIRAMNYRYPDTPQVPELPLNRYDKINDIEKILYDAYTIYQDTMENVYYLGELYDTVDDLEIKNIKNYYYADYELYMGEEIGVI